MANTRQRRQLAAARAVEAFNSRFAVGVAVRYTPYPGAAPIADRVFAPAELLGGHTAVVWLAGQKSCVACSHVEAAK